MIQTQLTLVPSGPSLAATALTLLIKKPSKPKTVAYYERKLYLAAMATFSAGRRAVDKATLDRAFVDGPVAVEEAMLPAVVAVEAAAYTLFKPVNRQIYGLSGHATYASLPAMRTAMRFAKDDKTKSKKPKPVTTSFDMLDPEAVAWVENHALELAKDLSKTSRKDITAAIHRAFVETGDPIRAKREIMQSIGSASRAETISRTEIQTAQNEGRRAGWKQAADDDLIAKDATKVWIIGGGACDLCAAFADMEIPIDGIYPGGGGLGPPLHPRCRCTEGLV